VHVHSCQLHVTTDIECVKNNKAFGENKVAAELLKKDGRETRRKIKEKISTI